VLIKGLISKGQLTEGWLQFAVGNLQFAVGNLQLAKK
jgi:hypothetical protein